MLRTFLIALAVLMLGCQSPRSGGDAERMAAATIAREPSASAAFVAAFARGDEALADGVASPLYRYEWARRAVTVEDRLAVVPHRREAGAASAEWIHFRFEGGVRDAAGFGHLIYTARLPDSAGDATASVWRFDVDGENRVIWGELVWLFSGDSDAVVRVQAHPPGVETGAVLLGLRSASGPEGFYALAPTEPPGPSNRPSSTLFLAVGPEGGTRVGAWSYGAAPYPGPGRRRAVSPPASPDVIRLRASYIAAL